MHAITYYSILALKFDLVLVKLHMAADKIVYFGAMIDNIINSSYSSCIVALICIISLIFGISLHSPILVPSNSIIIIVSILYNSSIIIICDWICQNPA